MDISLLDLWQNLLLILSAGIKDRGSLHPLIVHFPIGLLLTAPFVIVLAAVFPKQASGLRAAFLVMLWFGTLTLFAAYVTGESASEAVGSSAGREAVAVLDTHAHLAELCRLIFGVLTLAVTGYILASRSWAKKWSLQIHVLIVALFFAAYTCGIIALINTAHQGGLLVHRYEVSSHLFSSP